MRVEIPLVGAGGEPVDLLRTLTSHGIASLPPMLLDQGASTLEVTLPVASGRPRTVVIAPGRQGNAQVSIPGRRPAERAAKDLLATVRHVLALDLDLSEFYRLAGEDPELAWVASGAGRMIRSPTVFEDVVKTLCTTNASWALTTRMITALVQHLGEAAQGAPPDGWRGRAFPSPAAMAARDERFYREVVRAGYRAPHLVSLSRAVAGGSLELEPLGDPASRLSDDEVEAQLLALPGIGPYAAAHVMLVLGRYSRLILDSWTRPKYARVRRSRRPVSDAAIVRRFRPYGRWAGLAFWCYLTRDWVD